MKDFILKSLFLSSLQTSHLQFPATQTRENKTEFAENEPLLIFLRGFWFITPVGRCLVPLISCVSTLPPANSGAAFKGSAEKQDVSRKLAAHWRELESKAAAAAAPSSSSSPRQSRQSDEAAQRVCISVAPEQQQSP